MVLDSDLVTRLREILDDSDLNTATTGSVRRKLEEDFGVDLSDRKNFIREQIDVYLEILDNNNKEEEEEEDVAENKMENEDENENENENENDAVEEEEESEGQKSLERTEKEVKKRRGGGFTKLCSLSPQLQKFVGVPELARTEVVKKLWAYIRKNNLQDPKNRRNIKCDEALRDLFRVNSINMFQMNKVLSKHIWPLTTETESEKLKENEVGNACTSEGSNDPGEEEEDEEVEEKKYKEEQKEEKEEDEEEEDNERSKKGRAAKVNKDVKKRGGGFTKLCSLSPQLQKFTGESELGRTEVVKKLWKYIREKNLQDPQNRRNIICDDSLHALFRVDSINMFQMNKALSKHIWPLNEEDAPDNSSHKERWSKQGREEESKKLKENDEEGNDCTSEGSNDPGEEEEEKTKEEEDEEEEEKTKEEDEEEEEKNEKEEDEDEEEEEKKEKEEDGEEEEDNERSKKGRAAEVNKDVRKRGGGFTKLCSLSPQLQEFTGESELGRTEVVKKLWKYIREKNLQDPKNRRNIICDESLRTLFRVDSINMFQMNKSLSKHIWPINEEDAPDNSSHKERRSKQRREEDSDEIKQKEKRQKKGVSGLLAPVPLSDALIKFIGTGENELSRGDVIKRVWEYIKENDLQDPSDKRIILCDDKLKELFEVDSFNGFTVSKLLTTHFIKMEQ